MSNTTDQVTFTIDGIEITVPKGTLIIRAAEQLGIEIPRFCDHPLLEPAGACRQCLVDVPDMGNGRGMPKPAASCTTTAMQGMVVKTQHTSEVAKDAQEGIMEFLLINHPLDCPVCDKGGECPLQNQAMSTGRTETRMEVQDKRRYKKALPISSQVLLDRERCVLCARCTRFSDQIAGDPFIELMERSALEQVGVYEDEPFESYFSGNTVQICPVGALTGTQYRFRSRPFDLVSSPSVCEHCSAGCAQRSDHRRGKVLRRLAGEDPAVNEEWNCDKGRWAMSYIDSADRITKPLVREADGSLREASWPEALRRAAAGLRGSGENGSAAENDRGRVGVLTGGRLTVEDAYAYSKFARVALGTNDIDFRSRPHSTEESEFLAHAVAGVYPSSGAVTYEDLEHAPVVLTVGLEVEEECPIAFLRLRKAVRNRGQRVHVVAPFATNGTRKLNANLIESLPGEEAELIDGWTRGGYVRDALAEDGAVILLGERLATVEGAFSAAVRLARATGARIAWIPRRAGDRGAVEAGCLPGLLPGGGLASFAADRDQLAEYWGVESLPDGDGRGAWDILQAAADGDIDSLLIGGVDPYDFADAPAVEAALYAARFVVSLEIRHSAVTRVADVVLPVAPVTGKAGAFFDWEGRLRTFDTVIESDLMSDHAVLDALAEVMGVKLGLGDTRTVRGELAGLPDPITRQPAPDWSGDKPARSAEEGKAVLATWRQLLDGGSLQDNNPHLAGCAPAPVVRLSAATAKGIGAAEGAGVTVSTSSGGITLPLAVTDMPDGVVWLPQNAPGRGIYRHLGAGSGDVVQIRAYASSPRRATEHTPGSQASPGDQVEAVNS